MKFLSRFFSALLLCAMLGTFTLWRKEALPDMAGISAMMGEGGMLSGLLDKLNPSDGSTPSYVESQTVAGVSEALDELMSGAIDQLQVKVDISSLKMPAETVKEQMEIFFLTHPEFFFVSTRYTLSSHPRTGVAMEIELVYTAQIEHIPAMRAEYAQILQQIISTVPQGYNQFDQVLYLHDYLVQHFTYDYEGLRQEEASKVTSGFAIRDAYSFFTKGKGVCQGYTLAFMALCAELDIRNVPVTCDAINHVWNLVEVDGEWYHVDVTWDDAGGETSAVYPSYISYDYFLLSSKELYTRPDRNRTWKTTKKAESNLYDDAVWHNATTPMVKLNGKYYCMVYPQEGVALYGGEPTQMQELAFLQANWGYEDAWSGIVVWQGALVFNTQNTFYRFDVQTGTHMQIGSLMTELGSLKIFGLCGITENGVITYVAANEYHGNYDMRTWTVPAT